MRIYTLAELRGLPQPAEVLSPAELTKPCALPRRDPLTPQGGILGGMVDALNAALIDACPTPACLFPKTASIDFSPWIRDDLLVQDLYVLAVKAWPEAKLEGMKITIIIPPIKKEKPKSDSKKERKSKRKKRKTRLRVVKKKAG